MKGSRMKPCAKTVRMSLLIGLAAVLLLTVSACGRQRAAESGTDRNPAPTALPDTAKQLGRDTARELGQDTNVDGFSPKPDTADSPAAQKIEVSQSIADAIAGLNEVKTANVLVTDENAYVAVVLEPGAGKTLGASPSPDQSPGTTPGAANTPAAGDVTDELKNRIAQKAKSVNTNIRHVYVSASPDFVERMNTYRQDIQNGRPAAGFIKEFYTVVERLFPTRAGHTNPIVTP